MPHVLVVGGTGMLKGVPSYYTGHGCTVSVIARNQQGLNELIESKGESGFINPVRADYHDYFLLKDKIVSAIESYGSIEACVCWIHSTAPDAPYIIADILNDQNVSCKYFHVLGCEYKDPYTENLDIEKSFKKYENLVYRKIILGFVNEDDHSRWLSNTEISNGVTDGIIREKYSYIVGTVEPWERKPPY
ncbi:MAG: short-chain dehydrogenase [Ignavibacteria bacterium]